MSTNLLTSERVTPTAPELESIHQLAQLLGKNAQPAKLVSSTGEETFLPESVYHVLRIVLAILEDGHAVSITPADHELTTQEAADLLNVSRPFLYKLLDEGQIPCHQVGSHRRIYFEDLIQYKQMRDGERRTGLKNLTQLTEELGGYDSETENLAESIAQEDL